MRVGIMVIIYLSGALSGVILGFIAAIIAGHRIRHQQQLQARKLVMLTDDDLNRIIEKSIREVDEERGGKIVCR